MTKNSSVFLVFIFLINACSLIRSQIPKSHIEVIDYKSMLFKMGDKEFISPETVHSQKVWYKDSIAIEEITSLSIHQEGDKTSTITNTILFYRYNNLRTRNIYEYVSFYDTASISASYSMDDTTKIIGGWNFLFERKIPFYSPPEILPDTVIADIQYKRIRVLKGTNDAPYLMIYYCRCDKEFTVFDKNPLISKVTGCPVVKSQYYYPLKNGISSSSEVVFLSDTLTENEQRIFEAWQRNEIENPVKKKRRPPE